MVMQAPETLVERYDLAVSLESPVNFRQISCKVYLKYLIKFIIYEEILLNVITTGMWRF